MDLPRLFQHQSRLNRRIIEQRGLKENLLDTQLLALLVEIAELAQAWRGFKVWRSDRSPRRPEMLEEYSDCVHFFASTSLMLGVDPEAVMMRAVRLRDIITQFRELFRRVAGMETPKDWEEASSSSSVSGKCLECLRKKSSGRIWRNTGSITSGWERRWAMYTSNFARLRRLPDTLRPISIARGTPRWFKGPRYEALAPEWEWLRSTREEYDQVFRRRLSQLDPARVYEDLGENAVLLCWCRHNAGCHRRLVAEWLEKNLGVVIPEWGYPRSNCRPYDTCRWDKGPLARKAQG